MYITSTTIAIGRLIAKASNIDTTNIKIYKLLIENSTVSKQVVCDDIEIIDSIITCSLKTKKLYLKNSKFNKKLYGDKIYLEKCGNLDLAKINSKEIILFDNGNVYSSKIIKTKLIIAREVRLKLKNILFYSKIFGYEYQNKFLARILT
jgi:hypothetical protein